MTVPTDNRTAQTVESILAELAPLVDDVYPVVSAIDPRFPVHTRMGTIEVFPDTMTPAAWSSSGAAISRSTQRFAVEMGMLSAAKRIHFQGVFYGCCATNISSYIHINRRMPGAPWFPWTRAARAIVQPHADPIIGWEPPGVAAWLADCGYRLRGLRKSRRLEASLQAEIAPREIELERAEGSVAAHDYEALDAAALIEELKRPTLNAALVRLHVGVTIFVGSQYLKLATAIARWTQLPPIQTANALLVALGDVESAKPARALRAIAAQVRTAPRLAASLRSQKLDEFASALRAPNDDAERRVAEARAEFLRVFGYRGIGESTLDATTWAEDPGQADRLLALYVDDSDDQRGAIGAEQRNALQREILAGLPSKSRREKMSVYIAKAQTFAALRERTKSMTVRQSLRTRRVMKALTNRLVAERVFESEGDREMLSFKELINILKTDRAVTRATIVRRRKAYELLRKLDIVEMTFAGLPTPQLSVSDASGPAEVGTLLSGLGISPGRVEGIACVVRDPRQVATLKPGNILVAPYTDAAWSPLFLLASGIVIDSATVISHGATVARELGLPAIANVPGTTSIANGDRISIDAATGEVRILARASPSEVTADENRLTSVHSTFEFTPERFAVLRALHLKGRATPDTLSLSAALPLGQVSEVLAAASAAGLCCLNEVHWQPTPAGLDWVQEGVACERPESAHAEALHEQFLGINVRFKQFAFDWQMRSPEVVNDHGDPDYDAAVLKRLDTLHVEIGAVMLDAATLVPRLRPYRERLDRAFARIKAGERKFLMSPLLDSYHTIWFEFHEELIGMTGRTRAAEAEAGRAA